MIELNTSLQKYVILLEARWIIFKIRTGLEYLINNRNFVEKFSVDFFLGSDEVALFISYENIQDYRYFIRQTVSL